MKNITIGIVTFDRIELLKRSINSVLNQTYKNFIILIGNDNPNIKLSLNDLGISHNNKIKIFNNKKNLGERGNLNNLLNNSKTEIFCWLGDDDYLHKDFFKILINQFEKNNKIVASYSNYSRAILKKKLDRSRYETYDKYDFLEGFTSKKLRLIGTFGLIKTKYLKKIGGIHKTGTSFKIKNKITHHYPYCDLLVPILLTKFGKISWIDKRLVFLNTDIKSISSRTDDYHAYNSAESYVNFHLRNVLNKIKYDKRYYKILENLNSWFIFNKLTIIKKRTIFKNLFYLNNYIRDIYNLSSINSKKNDNIKLIYNNLRLFKSIIISFKNIL